MTGKKDEGFWSSVVGNVELSIGEIIEVLPLIPTEQAVMIWGGPGLGKTRAPEVVAKNIDANFRVIVTSTYEPTDIGGVPIPITNEDGAIKFVRYLVAKWAYDATVQSSDDKPMILLFDDITTSHEQVQAACYRLFLDREIGDLKLRDNVRLIAAGNRPEDNAATHEMPTPLGNRLLHLYAKAEVKSWINWALEEGNIHPWLIGFIRTRNDLLNTFKPDSAEKAFATPRSIEMLSKLLYSLEKHNKINQSVIRYKLASGLVGNGWALEFFQFVKIADKAIPPEEIAKDPENVTIPSENEIDLLHATIASCESYLKENVDKWEAFAIYTFRLQLEFGILLSQSIASVIIKELKNNSELTKTLASNKNAQKMFDTYSKYFTFKLS